MSDKKSVLVIGGYGHIGRFLVPRLVKAGWRVTVLTRGQHAPPDSDAWRELPHRHVVGHYQDLTDTNRWPDLLKDITPTAVIDILARNAPAVARACPAGANHVVVCGSVWMYGPPRQIPTPERTQGPFPFESYRVRYRHLQELLAAANGPAITGVMPSNIAGPGKVPIDPYGTREIAVHKAMADGVEIVLPYGGLTLVGPADAEDVAEVFALAVEQPDKSAGRMFNAAAAYALTFAELVATYGRIYGVEIPIRSVGWDEFDRVVRPTPDQRYHHEAHMCADITAARRVLGYEPKHSPEAALQRAVEWMRAKQML
jgi:nucleoside-diphosphate-sugar epimerase